MRWALAGVCALSIGRAAAAPHDQPLKPFDAGTGSPSVTSPVEDKTVERTYSGIVTSINDEDGGYVIVVRGTLTRRAVLAPNEPLPVDAKTPERDRFHVTMPTKLRLPFGIGDTIRATMGRTRVGHHFYDPYGMITGADDEPLLAIGRGAKGWSFAVGSPVHPRGRDAVIEDYVVVRGPGGLVGKVAGTWATGSVDGTSYAVTGGASHADVTRRPHDWANTFFAVLVKMP